ncbi:MAG: lipid II flippase Amj family protein [Bacillota bacterium]
MDRLLAVAALTSLIHLINTLIYSVRVSGVRTGRLATAISLFNVVFLVSSTANMIQGPLLATMVEGAIHRGGGAAAVEAMGWQMEFTESYAGQINILAGDFRLVILSATFGTILGWLLIPYFIELFSRAILFFEKTGSISGMIYAIVFLPPHKKELILRTAALPPEEKRGGEAIVAGFPITFLAMNVIVTGVFTTGVISALYAGSLYPGYRASATMLASVVNGFAQVLFATIVDPAAARITDQAIRGDREESEVRKMAFYLAGTRLAGTLLAQGLFIPAAYLVRFVAISIT